MAMLRSQADNSLKRELATVPATWKVLPSVLQVFTPMQYCTACVEGNAVVAQVKEIGLLVPRGNAVQGFLHLGNFQILFCCPASKRSLEPDSAYHNQAEKVYQCCFDNLARKNRAYKSPGDSAELTSWKYTLLSAHIRYQFPDPRHSRSTRMTSVLMAM